MSRKRRRPDKKTARRQSPYLRLPYHQQLRNPWKPYEIATEQMIADIHDASMRILENTGIRFQDEYAMDLWEKAGAKVDRSTQHVWPDRGLIVELIAKAPASFTVHGRNNMRSRFIGENSINFHPNAGMVFARDLDRGRRPGTEADWITNAKLIQMTNVMHFAPIMPVVMHDVPVHEKHLRGFWNGSIYSDKPLMTTSHGYIIPQDGIDMAKIVHGGLRDDGPITGGVINVNSPLVFDDRMLGGMITFAKSKQFVIVTPFILAGAMSPVTIAAAVAQQNAEALAGIALLQLVNPGTPAIYGGFTTNVDMKSGAPAFGTPEGAWALFLGAQLARHYELPYRGSGGLNTANIPDGQSSAESLWSLWPCIMSHTNMVVHAAGWLESGLTVSFEKFVMDVENLAMMQHMLQGPEWGEDAFALDSIHEVGPAGHNFGTAHTQARFETAFYPAFLHDRRNLGTWQEAGGEDIVVRANKLWKDLIRQYEAPPLDIAIKEELQDFIARRTIDLENVDLYD
ncbi:MAG: trimethylamine methyltransferase family protein [Candidatus Promineifilaceae bacterium]